MSQEYNINSQIPIIEPVKLVDEISTTEYYIGISINGKDVSREFWQIKRIQKTGNTWKFEFPNGNQDFVFKWDDRFAYTYNA